MLTIICGNIGSGKTLLLTVFAILSKYTKIVSNYELGFNYEPFSLYKMGTSQYDNSLVLIDEIYSIVDSRNANRNENKVASYFLFQSRKTSLEVIGTLQLFSSLDLRFRNMAYKFIHAIGIVDSHGRIYSITDISLIPIQYHNKLFFKYVIYQIGRPKKRVYISISQALSIIPYYNTFELIKPPNQENIANLFKSRDERLHDVSVLAKKVLDAYPNEKKITHDQIELYLFKNKLDQTLKKFVYLEVKEQLRMRNINGTN